MAQSHTALRVIRRLLGKCQRGWHCERLSLTPALSLGERESPPLAFSTTQRGVCPTNFPNNRTCRRLFPLPVGEGQGEGNEALQYREASHSADYS